MITIEIFADELNKEDVAHLTPHRGARAIIEKDGEVCLLFHEHSGHVTLPGGGVHPDESPEEAVRREVREESGCDVEHAEPSVRIKEHFVDSVWHHDFFRVRPGECKRPLERSEEEKRLGLTPRFVPLEEALEYLGKETGDAVLNQIQRRELIALMHSI